MSWLAHEFTKNIHGPSFELSNESAHSCQVQNCTEIPFRCSWFITILRKESTKYLATNPKNMMLPSTTCVEIENGLNPTPPPQKKRKPHKQTHTLLKKIPIKFTIFPKALNATGSTHQGDVSDNEGAGRGPFPKTDYKMSVRDFVCLHL